MAHSTATSSTEKGFVDLIDVGPQSPRDAWVRPLCLVGSFAFLGGFAALSVGAIADPLPWWHPETAALGFLVGLAAVLIAFLAAPRLAAPRGEWWKYFPESAD